MSFVHFDPIYLKVGLCMFLPCSALPPNKSIISNQEQHSQALDDDLYQ